jgi:CRISPR-associated endoribonuclease Cas6
MSSFATLTITFEPTQQVLGHERTAKHPCNLGPYFQGLLMEHVSPEYAHEVHQQSFNPYSQYVVSRGDTLVWTVHALNEQAIHAVIEPLLSTEFKAAQLKALGGAKLSVVGKQVSYLSQQDLTKVFYAPPSRSPITVHFLTPTAFRQDGAYLFMPDIRLVFQSLMMRYSAVLEGDKEPDELALAELVRTMRISSYNIKSQYFVLGTTRIPAFVGTCKLRLGGAATLQSYARMLLAFGTMSGVGIKPSMGMGAMSVVGLTAKEPGGKAIHESEG